MFSLAVTVLTYSKIEVPLSLAFNSVSYTLLILLFGKVKLSWLVHIFTIFYLHKSFVHLNFLDQFLLEVCSSEVLLMSCCNTLSKCLHKMTLIYPKFLKYYLSWYVLKVILSLYLEDLIQLFLAFHC